MPIHPYPLEEPAFKPIAFGPPDPAPRTHGGRRPGAGAPRRNLNAVKLGYRNKDLMLAAMLILTIPDVASLFDAIVRSRDRRRFRALLAEARRLNREDPDHAHTIKLEAAQAILANVIWIQSELAAAQKITETIKQSSRGKQGKPG